MRTIYRFGICAMILCLFGLGTAAAQPGGGRGERGDGGARRAMMMAMRVPVEQVLGFLAFDEKVNLNHDQLGKVRDALKGIYTQRAELMEKLRESNDREMAMTEVAKLRSQMTQKLTAILNDKQVEALKHYMQNMTQRSGRGGQGRRGRDGGGGRDDGA